MSLQEAKRRSNLIINNILRLQRYNSNNNFSHEIATLPSVARNDTESDNFGTILNVKFTQTNGIGANNNIQ
jgi:K+/H+ antiporter YhaU regulatory subunit KhtT